MCRIGLISGPINHCNHGIIVISYMHHEKEVIDTVCVYEQDRINTMLTVVYPPYLAFGNKKIIKIDCTFP